MMTTDADAPTHLTRTISYATACLASLALLIGPLSLGAWQMAAAALALGILACIAIAKDWGRPLGAVEFIGFVLLAALETLQRVHPLWGLLGVTAALATWDLYSFRARLADAGFVAHPEILLRQHLTRLGGVTLLALLLGGIALFLRIDYGIGTVVALACLLALGLSRIVVHIRRRSD